MNRLLGMMQQKELNRIGRILIILFLWAGLCHGAEETVSKITILGNVKVEEAAIRAAIKTREDRPFSMDQVREEIHRQLQSSSSTQPVPSTSSKTVPTWIDQSQMMPRISLFKDQRLASIREN